MADTFTPDEIQKCVDAMAKPGPIDALKLIASGRAIIEISRDGRDVVLDSIDGKPVRDPDFPERKMGLAGAWPLYRAGMIDRFGLLTAAGHATIKSKGGAE